MFHFIEYKQKYQTKKTDILDHFCDWIEAQYESLVVCSHANRHNFQFIFVCVLYLCIYIYIYIYMCVAIMKDLESKMKMETKV